MTAVTRSKSTKGPTLSLLAVLLVAAMAAAACAQSTAEVSPSTAPDDAGRASSESSTAQPQPGIPDISRGSDPVPAETPSAPPQEPVLVPRSTIRPSESSPQALLSPLRELSDWSVVGTGDPLQFPMFLCRAGFTLPEFPPKEGDGLLIAQGPITVSVVARTYGDGNELASIDRLQSVDQRATCEQPLGAFSARAPRPFFLDPGRNTAIDDVVGWSTGTDPDKSLRPDLEWSPVRSVAHGLAWAGDGAYLAVVANAEVASFDNEAVAAETVKRATELISQLLYTEAFIAFDTNCNQQAMELRDPTIVAGARVVDGRTLHHCFGDEAPFVTWWPMLREIAGPDVLQQVTLLTAHRDFERAGYVAEHADGYGRSGLSLQAGLGANSTPVESWLPVAVHELAHVVAAGRELPLPRQPKPRRCTSDNDRDCYHAVEMLEEWATRFWSQDDLTSVEVDGYRNDTKARERCQSNPSFVTSYAATNPKEDLAEAVVAFVFDHETAAAAQPKLDFLAEQPEFLAMRERARDLGVQTFPRRATCG